VPRRRIKEDKMGIVKSNPAAETVGVSPKVAWPAVALAALGVVLCVLDLIGVIDVDDELWIALLGASGGTGLLGFVAPAALQSTKDAPDVARTRL
jgi:hypothetical protein